MKKDLLEILICPRCLPRETPLSLLNGKSLENDIKDGLLTCSSCGSSFPIEDGVAFLAAPPDPSARYETAPLLSSYLWSHFGDIMGEDGASDAYARWSDLMEARPGPCLDIGCAVGRFAFEMTKKSDLVIGIDSSASFIRAARELAVKGKKPFSLVVEGDITRPAEVVLPDDWDLSRVEFIVADALALPFPKETFSSLAGLNLIDKLPEPITHFCETNRVAKAAQAQFLFSDPFSWSAEAAAQKNWLGGTEEGPWAGRGPDNVAALLSGEKGPLAPAWHLADAGSISWKIRTHENHYELIVSRYIKAVR